MRLWRLPPALNEDRRARARTGLRSFFTRDVCLVLAMAVALGGMNGLDPLDNLMADVSLRRSGRKPSDQIVIIAIDEPSLGRMGRWPWPRSVHAQLLERLRRDYQPAAVGLDVSFGDPDPQNSDNDRRLELAVGAAGNIVLSVATSTAMGQALQFEQPPAALARAARALGHVHYETASDGRVRGVFLREGSGDHRLSHFALAVLEAAGRPVALRDLPGKPATGPVTEARDGSATGAWLREYAMEIPFAGPAGHFRRVSCIDVMNGRVPVDQLRGKLVLIGTTAAGMGDAYPTPVSGRSSAMPGIELTANLIDALIQGVRIERASPWQNALFNLFPALLCLLALRRLDPRHALVSVLLLAAAVPLVAAGLRLGAGPVFAPMAGSVNVLLCYINWSWRRQEMALRYLSDELARIQHQHPMLEVETQAVPSGDAFERRLTLLQRAARQMRELNLFVRTSLDSLPDAMLVTDAQGNIALANAAALQRLGHSDFEQLRGRSVREVLAGYLTPGASALPALQGGADAQPFAVETGSNGGQDLLIKATPRVDGDERFGGWILTLVDISFVREAQRKTEEALRFISHDIRAPQSSILTLIELHRSGVAGLQGMQDVLKRVEAHARQSLSLADDFLHLARAESQVYRLEICDISELVIDATDQMWVAAKAHDIRLLAHMPQEPAMSLVDRGLMTRAIANLLSNAIKYSARHQKVDCRVLRDGPFWCVSVRDRGIGIAEHEIPQLFQRFRRLNSSGRAAPEGAGLGLTFVQAVATQHGGLIKVVSKLGEGSEFRLLLPVARMDEHAG